MQGSSRRGCRRKPYRVRGNREGRSGEDLDGRRKDHGRSKRMATGCAGMGRRALKVAGQRSKCNAWPALRPCGFSTPTRNRRRGPNNSIILWRRGRRPHRWKSRRAVGRALHCKLVISCFFGKHFARLVGAPLVGALHLGTHEGCPYKTYWLRPKAALRYLRRHRGEAVEGGRGGVDYSSSTRK